MSEITPVIHDIFPLPKQASFHGHDPVAQFYENENFLIKTVVSFLSDVLSAGASSLLIATPEHASRYREQLELNGVDMDAAVKNGQLALIEAPALLAKFVNGTTLNPQLFKLTMRKIIDPLTQIDSPIHLYIYNEMVDLLWRQKNIQAAFYLEKICNKLQKKFPFSLLCPYLIGHFSKKYHRTYLQQVGAEHSRMVPAESFSIHANSTARLQQITLLQQRLCALETELFHRKQVETQLRKSEAALSESERRFRTLAEATCQMIWRANTQGELSDLSKTWHTFTGVSIAAWQMDNSYNPVHPEDRPHIRATWEEAKAKRLAFESEYRLQRHDGIYLPMAVRGVPVFNDDGSIHEWVGTLTDMSAYKLAEEERKQLLLSERAARQEAEAARRRAVLLDELTNSMVIDLSDAANVAQKLAQIVVPRLADGCAIYAPKSPDGIEVIAIASHDPHLSKECIQKLTLDATLKWNPEGVIRSGRSELISDTKNLHFIPEKNSTPEINGSEVGVVSQLIVPLKSHGGVIGCLGLIQTRSGRHFDRDDVLLVEEIASRAALVLEQARLYQEAQNARDEAQAANKAKDEFLAMLGHELRNPLSPIVTALQLMKLRDDKKSIIERNTIERQVNHMVRLVDDLLDVSRITRGKVAIKKKPVELTVGISKAIEMASPLFEQRGHHLSVNIPACGMFVDGDEVRLAQVFANLLTNAAKYTPPGGFISIEASRKDNDIIVRVKDNGGGISSDLMPSIFDLFVQGQRPLARSEGGLGIGLTLVRNLIALHDGKIDVVSEGVNQGSEFIVTLPASKNVESKNLNIAATEPMHLLPPANRRQLLLVDDNIDAVELLATLLQNWGYSVKVAHDSLEALEMVRVFKIDVAILDIGLPVMDGYELATNIRNLLGDQAPRLIALTGYGQDQDSIRSKKSGFSFHLVKPIEVEKLKECIEVSTKN